MKKLLIAGSIIIVIVVAAIALLVSNVDTLIKKGVETAGPKILQAPVTLKDVNISLSSGSGELKGLTIGNPSGYKTEYAFQLGGISIDLDLESLASDKIHIQNILINSPKIIYEGVLGEKTNLSQLLANVENFAGESKVEKTDSSEDEKSAGSKKVQIDYIKIADGSIRANLDMVTKKDLTLPLPNIELRDIGKSKEATMSEALRLILAAINKAALPAVQGSITDLTKGLKDEAIQETTQKGLDKLKGLLSD